MSNDNEERIYERLIKKYEQFVNDKDTDYKEVATLLLQMLGTTIKVMGRDPSMTAKFFYSMANTRKELFNHLDNKEAVEFLLDKA